jgi:O-succinylbenzoic acid--CoA ligase
MVKTSPRELLPVPSEWSIAQVQQALQAALDGSGPALAFGPTRHKSVPAEIAIVIPTSGSTGVAKEVALSAAAVIASARAAHTYLNAVEGERWSLLLPISHIAGVNVLVRALELKSELVDLRKGGIYEEVAFTSVVPTQLFRALNGDQALLAHLQQARAVLVGGAATPLPLISAAINKNINIVTTYGMSEMSGGCIYNNEPLLGVDARVDQHGVIALSGAMRATTYLGADELWKLSNDGDWFVTSDIGEFRDGKLFIHGRIDDQIISGGEKISLSLIERKLNNKFPTQSFMSFSVASVEWGAILCLASESEIDVAAVKEFLRAAVGSHAVPKEFFAPITLPFTSIGKADRPKLRALFERQREKL